MPVFTHGPDEVVYRVRMSKQHRADLHTITRLLYEHGVITKNCKGHFEAKAAIEAVIDQAMASLGVYRHHVAPEVTTGHATKPLSSATWRPITARPRAPEHLHPNNPTTTSSPSVIL